MAYGGNELALHFIHPSAFRDIRADSKVAIYFSGVIKQCGYRQQYRKNTAVLPYIGPFILVRLALPRFYHEHLEAWRNACA